MVATPPVVLLIAGLFHDASRFYEGYYVHMQDEPAIGTAEYLDYKTHQHCEQAAEFAVTWLREVGVGEDVARDVEILVLHHEGGINVDLFSEHSYGDAIVSMSQLLQRADAISQFDPSVFIGSFNTLADPDRPQQGFNMVCYKYGRLLPEDKQLVAQTIKESRDVFMATYEGQKAYSAFQGVTCGSAAEVEVDAVAQPGEEK